MKFGVREICDVVFKANQAVKIGGTEFVKGQPVLYIDTAKTSTIEGAASTVYATGGRGNSRLIAWEGEKTLTFTVEDALLSPMGFAILSGAGLFDLAGKTAMVHCTAEALIDTTGKITLDNKISTNAPVFVTIMEDGSFVEMLKDVTVANNVITVKEADKSKAGKQVFVDYYEERTAKVTEIQIDAGHFAGYYYVEASTLFRRESDGKDLPAEIVFPRVKVQSNFTFTMASSGDPSTFTFTMDAFPAYTLFDKTHKVLCAMQIIDDYIQEADQVAVTDFDPLQPVSGLDVDSSATTTPAVPTKPSEPVTPTNN
jgi:hypothetical protein